MPTERKERLLQEIEASTSKIIDIEYMLNAERKQRRRLYEEFLLEKYGWVSGKSVVLVEDDNCELQAYRIDGISGFKDGGIEALQVAHIGLDQEEIGYHYYASWEKFFEGKIVRTFEDVEAYWRYFDIDEEDPFIVAVEEKVPSDIK